MNGFVNKKVLEAFKQTGKGEKPIEPVRIVKSTGEEIEISTLAKINDKEFANKANKWNNVIWQNDEVKTKLDDTKQIEKDKKAFLEEITVDNQSINDLVSNLEDINMAFSNLKNLSEKNPNWNNIFQIQTKSDDYNPLLELDFDNYKSKKTFENIIKDNDSLSLNLKRVNAEFDKLSIENFSREDIANEDELQKYKKDLFEKNEDIIKRLSKRKIEANKIIKALGAFERALELRKSAIKVSEKDSAVEKAFIASSKSYFIKYAKYINEIKTKFDNLTKNKVSIKLGEQKTTGILTLKADEEVVLNRDVIINLMKSVLYAPSSDGDIEKWIQKQLSTVGFKEFNRSNVLARITKELKNHVHIMADGKEYGVLSNGQKSIFGIKYKLSKAKNEFDTLFMDQPEDNLDNLTIKNELVDEIKCFRGQTFIVTHNANIGILPNVTNVIVADFDSSEPYKVGTINIDKEAESSDAADYLEGGALTLNERHNKIFKGENNEN